MLVKFQSHRFQLNKAFTLIEIMIFVSLLSMVLIVAVGYVTRLLMNMKVNEHKIYATFYVEEVSEWLISERYADWDGFQSKADATPTGFIYCFNNNLDLDDTVAILDPSYTTPNANRPYRVADPTNCPRTGITGNSPSIFRRVVTLKKNAAVNATQVTTRVAVSWTDNEVPYTQQVENVYTSR